MPPRSCPDTLMPIARPRKHSSSFRVTSVAPLPPTGRCRQRLELVAHVHVPPGRRIRGQLVAALIGHFLTNQFVEHARQTVCFSNTSRRCAPQHDSFLCRSEARRTHGHVVASPAVRFTCSKEEKERPRFLVHPGDRMLWPSMPNHFR